MRLVALILTLGCLSAGCAVQTGDPNADDEPQHHDDEIVAVSGLRPIAPVSGAAAAASPTSAPSTAVSPAGGETTLPPAAPAQMSGSSIQADNPNPSPWDPHTGH